MNRRSGGMGGPRGSRGSYSSFQGSPWQGSQNSSGFSSMASSPQQLALALTSLLSPQQNNPPSLLSLNTSYSNQDHSFDQYGRGREMRRIEPYNKNRGGSWRGDRRRNQNKNNKKDDKKNEKKDDGDKPNEKVKNGEDESTADAKDKAYHGVPIKLLNCFVCSKEMWDGESMKKHVRGRAHKQMMETLEDSIHCIVNILREHMRVAEERKVIEMQRLHRLNKKGGRNREPESHCNMCDMKFLGKIVSHRKSEGHQRLKRYLHPTCGLCDKEFPSRIEWIEHRLTPEHLLKLGESLSYRCGGANGDIVIRDEEDDNEEDEQQEAETVVKDVVKSEGDSEAANEEDNKENKVETESDTPILEMTDDLEELLNLPIYKPERALSISSLKQFTGYICELCDRTFDTEELSQNHLKTKIHYYAFVDAAKQKYREEMQKKDEAKKKQNESQDSETKENGDSEMYDPEEACNENEDGKEDETKVKEENEDVEMLEEEEVKEEIQQEVKEEIQEEVKEEVEESKAPVTSTPARQAKAKRGRK